MYSDMYINAVALKNFHLNLMVFMQINVLFICLVIFVVVDYVFIVKNPENINKHWNGMRKGGKFVCFSFWLFKDITKLWIFQLLLG